MMSIPEVEEISSFGRSIEIGHLYDIRNENIIDKKCFPTENIEMTVRNSSYQSILVKETNNINERANLMNISDNLKVSYICGMVQPSRSSRFITAMRSSSKVVSVSARWKSTHYNKKYDIGQVSRNFQEVELGKIKATHLVTGITYGLEVYFYFEKQVSTDKLMAIKELKQLVQNHFSCTPDDDSPVNLDGVLCRVFENNCHEPATVTFAEAREYLKSLSGKEPIPIRITLTPLHLINKCDVLVTSIRPACIKELCETRLLMDCMRNIFRTLCLKKNRLFFPNVHGYIEQIQQIFEEDLVKFESDLNKNIYEIRIGEGNESSVFSILEAIVKKYNKKSLEKWCSFTSNKILEIDFALKELACKSNVKINDNVQALEKTPATDVLIIDVHFQSRISQGITGLLKTSKNGKHYPFNIITWMMESTLYHSCLQILDEIKQITEIRTEQAFVLNMHYGENPISSRIENQSGEETKF